MPLRRNSEKTLGSRGLWCKHWNSRVPICGFSKVGIQNLVGPSLLFENLSNLFVFLRQCFEGVLPSSPRKKVGAPSHRKGIVLKQTLVSVIEGVVPGTALRIVLIKSYQHRKIIGYQWAKEQKNYPRKNQFPQLLRQFLLKILISPQKVRPSLGQ